MSARFEYLKDPDAIYRASFETIRAEAALEGPLGQAGMGHHAGDRIGRGVVIGEPDLAVGDDRVLVVPRPGSGRIGQLALAAVAEQEDLGDTARRLVAAEAADQVER